MQRAISAFLLALLVCACGEPDESDNNANANGETSIAMICEERGNTVADAIRNLPKTCSDDSECQVVARAGNCDCSNGVSASADLAEFEAAIVALDENDCVHPFSCAGDQCAYDRGYREPELIGVCEMGECAVAETMACSEFEANVYGGLIPPSRCETASDCMLRNDLNPCGCQEGVGTDFPFLAAQSTYDLIGLNKDRCDFVCDACPQVTEAACVQNVCIAQ